MKIILLLLLLLCVIPLIYAQADCATQTNCTSCATATGCGWCTATQKCLAGDENGPTTVNGLCLGNAWKYGVAQCARCDTLKSCRECNLHPSDCGWCATGNDPGCHDLTWFAGKIGGCKPLYNCPCADYSSCFSCLEGSNCQWCMEGGSCNDLTQACPTNTPVFNATVGCPCEYNKDCSSCKDAYNCQWCNNFGTCQSKSSTGTGCQVSVGDTCDSFCKSSGNVSCSVCNNLNGCAWCTAQKSCVDPSYTSCLITHTCDTCSEHKYCDPCLDNPNCLWCGSDSTCRPKSESAQCPMPAHSCIDVCNRFTSCESCNLANGCGWCPTSDGSSTGTCLDVDKAKCNGGLWAHTCKPTPIAPPQKCGFDGGSFVGGMFLVIGLIVVAGVAYLFYRWKTGRKILYTELR